MSHTRNDNACSDSSALRGALDGGSKVGVRGCRTVIEMCVCVCVLIRSRRPPQGSYQLQLFCFP